MVPDSTFNRRICAVFVADVTGYSAMMGEDDEGTARAIQGLNTLVQSIVAASGGHAEAEAGDSILATFDSVVGAVDAAVQIQQRLPSEEFASRRLQIRIGIHFGDVLRQDGMAHGEAINVAARLQSLARPGTICVSDSVYRHVRRRFDERFEHLGRRRLKNISEPVRAYLIHPVVTGARPPARWRPALPWAVGGTIALAAALAVVIVQRDWPSSDAETQRGSDPETQREGGPELRRAGDPETRHAGQGASGVGAAATGSAAAPAEAEQVALGVMFFKSLREDDSSAWMGEALRDGLNAQLSQFSRVKVYSKEYIDFMMTRKSLSEVEAATQLGIKKMLSGSFVVMGRNLRVETHVVDVGTGVIESAYTIQGGTDAFFDLMNKVVLGVIARMDLPVDANERNELLARRDQDVEALKLLMEAEGGMGATPSEALPSSTGDGAHSDLQQWFASLRLGPRSVSAAEPSDPETEIRDMLERYRTAAEAKRLDDLATVYLEFSERQRAAQQRYFDNARELRIAIEDVDVVVVGEEAVVSYTRTDDFSDARTGRPMHVSVRLTKTLRREDGAWKIGSGK